jgi:hypothetical protein
MTGHLSTGARRRNQVHTVCQGAFFERWTEQLLQLYFTITKRKFLSGNVGGNNYFAPYESWEAKDAPKATPWS